jgi:hypothetical protein
MERGEKFDAAIMPAGSGRLSACAAGKVVVDSIPSNMVADYE